MTLTPSPLSVGGIEIAAPAANFATAGFCRKGGRHEELRADR
jgi:hypothetical protein